MNKTRALLGSAALAIALPLLGTAPAHAAVIKGAGDNANLLENANLLGAYLNSSFDSATKTADNLQSAAANIVE